MRTILLIGVLVATSINVRSQVQNNSLEIELSIIEPPFLLEHNEKEDVQFHGFFKVSLINLMNETISLNQLNLHGLRFQGETDTSYYLFHDCACVQNYPSSIEAFDTLVITLNSWQHDGNYFKNPPQGKYSVSYGANKFKREFPNSKGDHRKRINDCRNKIYNQTSFDFTSNSKSIELKVYNNLDEVPCRFAKLKESSDICPVCNSNKQVVPIVYGYPSNETMDMADKGQLILGGCVVSDCDPHWHCKTDYYNF